METLSTCYKEIVSSFNIRPSYSNTIVVSEFIPNVEHGDKLPALLDFIIPVVYTVGCCDKLKTKVGYNYYNSIVLLPRTEYTEWWVTEWIKIIPEIGERLETISIKNKKYFYLKKCIEENWYRHHVIWTILRMSYYHSLPNVIYKYFRNYDFLSCLRALHLFIGEERDRFLVNYLYFTTNIETIRKNFRNLTKGSVYLVFSGLKVDFKNSIKQVKGIEKRIEFTNNLFKELDAVSGHFSSIFYYNKDTLRVYRLQNVFLKEELTIQFFPTFKFINLPEEVVYETYSQGIPNEPITIQGKAKNIIKLFNETFKTVKNY